MKRRNPLTVLLLSLVTLGIYMLVWLYKTQREIVAELQDKKAIPPLTILFSPLFAMLGIAIVTVFVKAITNGQGGWGVTTTMIFVLLFIIALIVPFFWFYKYAEAVHLLVPQTETSYLYVLWVVMNLLGVGFVWPLLVQTELNKYIDRQNDAGLPSESHIPTQHIPSKDAAGSRQGEDHPNHRSHSHDATPPGVSGE